MMVVVVVVIGVGLGIGVGVIGWCCVVLGVDDCVLISVFMCELYVVMILMLFGMVWFDRIRVLLFSWLWILCKMLCDVSLVN